MLSMSIHLIIDMMLGLWLSTAIVNKIVGIDRIEKLERDCRVLDSKYEELGIRVIE